MSSVQEGSISKDHRLVNGTNSFSAKVKLKENFYSVKEFQRELRKFMKTADRMLGLSREVVDTITVQKTGHVGEAKEEEGHLGGEADTPDQEAKEEGGTLRTETINISIKG